MMVFANSSTHTAGRTQKHLMSCYECEFIHMRASSSFSINISWNIPAKLAQNQTEEETYGRCVRRKHNKHTGSI